MEHKEQAEAEVEHNCSDDGILVDEYDHSLVQGIADIDHEMAWQRCKGNDNNSKNPVNQRELPYDHS